MLGTTQSPLIRRREFECEILRRERCQLRTAGRTLIASHYIGQRATQMPKQDSRNDDAIRARKPLTPSKRAQQQLSPRLTWWHEPHNIKFRVFSSTQGPQTKSDSAHTACPTSARYDKSSYPHANAYGGVCTKSAVRSWRENYSSRCNMPYSQQPLRLYNGTHGSR